MKSIFTTLFVLVSLIGFSQNKTAIHCGELLDVNTGKVLKKKTVVIQDNKIESIQNGYSSFDSGVTIIDLKDQLVLPGLIDMHVHLEHQSSPTTYIDVFKDEPQELALNAYYYANKTLKAGFTTVRDLGGSGGNNAARDAINKGMLVGPRIYSVRKSIAITGGHADPQIGLKLLQQEVYSVLPKMEMDLLFLMRNWKLLLQQLRTEAYK